MRSLVAGEIIDPDADETLRDQILAAARPCCEALAESALIDYSALERASREFLANAQAMLAAHLGDVLLLNATRVSELFYWRIVAVKSDELLRGLREHWPSISTAELNDLTEVLQLAAHEPAWIEDVKAQDTPEEMRFVVGESDIDFQSAIGEILFTSMVAPSLELLRTSWPLSHRRQLADALRHIRVGPDYPSDTSIVVSLSPVWTFRPERG